MQPLEGQSWTCVCDKLQMSQLWVSLDQAEKNLPHQIFPINFIQNSHKCTANQALPKLLYRFFFSFPKIFSLLQPIKTNDKQEVVSQCCVILIYRLNLAYKLGLQHQTSSMLSARSHSSPCLFSEQFNSFLFGTLLFKKINQPKGQNSCSHGALQILNIQIFIRLNQNQRL